MTDPTIPFALAVEVAADEKIVERVEIQDPQPVLVSSAEGRWQDGGDGFLYRVEPSHVEIRDEE